MLSVFAKKRKKKNASPTAAQNIGQKSRRIVPKACGRDYMYTKRTHLFYYSPQFYILPLLRLTNAISHHSHIVHASVCVRVSVHLLCVVFKCVLLFLLLPLLPIGHCGCCCFCIFMMSIATKTIPEMEKSAPILFTLGICVYAGWLAGICIHV